jgi:hypothetical protein
MSGVSGPSSPKSAARMEQVVSPQLAAQLHVHVPPDACGIEIESTPSALGVLVGAAVGAGVGGGETTHMGRLLLLAPPEGLGLK